jgi:hypothetical protein
MIYSEESATFPDHVLYLLAVRAGPPRLFFDAITSGLPDGARNQKANDKQG